MRCARREDIQIWVVTPVAVHTAASSRADLCRHSEAPAYVRRETGTAAVRGRDCYGMSVFGETGADCAPPSPAIMQQALAM